jgi:hypothetical protein
VEEHAGAAREFYKYVLDVVPDSAPAKLIKTLNMFIKKCIEAIVFSVSIFFMVTHKLIVDIRVMKLQMRKLEQIEKKWINI